MSRQPLVSWAVKKECKMKQYKKVSNVAAQLNADQWSSVGWLIESMSVEAGWEIDVLHIQVPLPNRCRLA